MPIAADDVAQRVVPTAELQQSSPSDFVWKLAFRAMFEELLRNPRRLQRAARNRPDGLVWTALPELLAAEMRKLPMSKADRWEFALTNFADSLEKKCRALQQHATHCAPRVPLLPSAVLPTELGKSLPCNQPVHKLVRPTLLAKPASANNKMQQDETLPRKHPRHCTSRHRRSFPSGFDLLRDHCKIDTMSAQPGNPTDWNRRVAGALRDEQNAASGARPSALRQVSAPTIAVRIELPAVRDGPNVL